MVGALRIIFVLMNTRIRQMAPPSDLGQRRVTGIVGAPLDTSWWQLPPISPP